MKVSRLCLKVGKERCFSSVLMVGDGWNGNLEVF
jgi:hypothetical protein